MSRNISNEHMEQLLRGYCSREKQQAFTFCAPKQRVFTVKTFAVCAAALILILSIAFTAAMHTSPAAPRLNAYSFSAEKLAAFCGKDKAIADKTADRQVAAWTPQIAYADSEKVVFGVATGVFVFDYHSGTFLNTFDLDKIGVPAFAQGDSFSSLTASDDGKRALLYSHTHGAPAEEWRLLNLETGEVGMLAGEEAFFEKYNSFQTTPVHINERDELPGWIFSSFAAVTESSRYLMALDFQHGAGSLGSLRLIVMDSKTGEIRSTVSVFENVKAK